MRRAIFIGILVLLMVFTAACGSGNPEPDLATPPGVEDPAESEGDEPQESMSAELPPIDQVDEVAAVLYQGIVDSENVVDFVEDIYEALGIPVLDPETEMDQIEAAIENQTPFTLESHLELIADALASGVHITLESFIAEMNREGFFALDSGGAVTLAYLSQNLAYLLEQDQFAPDEGQIALVLALGRTRAGLLYGEALDPVWGDDLLDPLQSSLLWLLLDQVAITSQSAAGQSNQHSSHLSALPDPQRRNLLGDLLGSLGEASKHLTEFCKTAKIFGHQSTLTLSESQLYRQTPGSKKTSGSEATFRLEFKYKPSTKEDQVSAALGCPDLPAKGARPDRPVEWELIDSGARGASLQSLGVFTPGGPTNGQGVSEANYLANLEPVPTYLQQKENLDAAAGLVKATADLYPGDGYMLAALTEYAGKPEVEGINMAQADLWVWYYTFPTVEWNIKEGPMNMEGIAFSCDGVNWVATHTYNLNAGELHFFTSAEFELTVPEIQLGDGVLSDRTVVNFEGTYTVGDDSLAITDTREVWLSFTEKLTTINFETLSATITADGNIISIPFAFHTGDIPANLLPNNSCDGE